jgi:hypothetical protein
MSTGGFAQRAFVEAGNLAATDDIHVGPAAEGLSESQQRPETSNWLPQVSDIARRLPQITASQAALATIQAATVNKLATPTAAQIQGGGIAGFGVASGTGGGGGGIFGAISGAIGEARFLASTASSVADFIGAPGQARSGDVFSVWQSLQQENLANQTPSGRGAGNLRQFLKKELADPLGIQGLKDFFNSGGFRDTGPNSHGGKPAQGN